MVRESLEARIQKLEDIEAIRRLTAIWCRALDTKDLELLVQTVDKDITLAIHGPGDERELKGLKEFKDTYKLLLQHYSFLRHNFCNHDINVTGSTGIADCYSIIEVAFTTYHAQPEYGVRGMVKNHWELKRFQEQWKVSHMDIWVQSWTEGPVKPVMG